MAYLVSPASYLTAAQFKAQANDYDLSGYTDSQIQDILNRASGKANSIMRRDLLAQERTIRFWGDGSNTISLNLAPVLYVKRVQVVIPGTTGISIPLDQLLIDYTDGQVAEYTPLMWQGYGLTMVFPNNAPVDVTLAHGYGASIVKAPTWTSTDSNGSLAAGSYNVAVTARTMWGEFPAAAQVVVTALGSIVLTIPGILGAYLYRAYISAATYNTTLTAGIAAGVLSIPVASSSGKTLNSRWILGSGSAAEIITVASTSSGVVVPTSATVNAHSISDPLIPVPLAVAEAPFTSLAALPRTIQISSLSPVNGLYPDELPLVDTSAPVLPAEIIEAVRILSLSMLYEQNNKANRGYNMEESGKKRVSWRSTEGTSGRGIPLLEEEAAKLLAPHALQGIF